MSGAASDAARGGVDAAGFRQGMRQLAAAVSIITTEHDGQRAGMTATAVTSLTAEPPQLGVAINRGNASYGMFGSVHRWPEGPAFDEPGRVAATLRALAAAVAGAPPPPPGA